VSWKEVIPRPVPDAENGAKLYLQAADIIKAREANRGAGYDSKDWRDAAKMAVVAKYVAEDADALALMKEAAGRPYAWFNLNWSDPPATLFPHLAKMRNLARFVGSAAIVASERGDQAEALDDLRVGFTMSRHVCPEPTLIDQLVCYAMDAIMVSAAEMVIGKGPLPEDKARALNEELGRVDYMAGMEKAMQMERCFGIYMFDQVRRHPKFIEQTVSPDIAQEVEVRWRLWAYAYLLRPLAYADERVYLEHMDRSAAMVGASWRETAGGPTVVPHEKDNMPRWAVLSGVLTPMFSRASARRDQAMAMRALVGAAMGVEMYKQKTGKYPAGLAEVREVGWKVGEDPFSGKELVYKVVGPTYLLYSIGPDLKDDGGKPGLWQMVEWGLQAPPQIRGGPPGTGRGGSVDNLAGVAGRDAGDLVWMGTWEAVQKARGG
jgi:hypothetical protein